MSRYGLGKKSLRPQNRSSAKRLFHRSPHDPRYSDIESRIESLVLVDNKDLSLIQHLRQTLSVVPPALTRHIVLFFPTADQINRPEKVQFDHKKLQREVLGIVEKICDKHPSKKRPADFFFGKRFERDRISTVSIDSFLGFRFRVLVNRYTEYMSLTMILDRPAGQAEQGSITLMQFKSACDEIIQNCSSQVENNKEIQSTDWRDTDKLYFVIWRALDKFFGINFENDLTGSIIGDFRGIILTPDGHIMNPVTPVSFSVLSEKEKDVNYLHDYFNLNKKLFLSILGMDEFGKQMNPREVESDLAPNNILCKMLDGGAIFGSTLANPLLDEKWKKRPIPGSFFIIYGGNSQYQLGRLIHRQHTMAELRVASLLDYKTIRSIGPLVREIGNEITNLIHRSSETSHIKWEEVSAIVKIYNEIGNKCHGGFLYRTSRSDHYRDTLFGLLPHTRESHIEGWQSYRRFLEVNLYREFRATSAIGDRYRQMALRIDRLVSIWHAERQMRFARTVAAFPLVSSVIAIVVFFATFRANSHGEFNRYVIGVCLAAVFIVTVILYARHLGIFDDIEGLWKKKKVVNGTN